MVDSPITDLLPWIRPIVNSPLIMVDLPTVDSPVVDLVPVNSPTNYSPVKMVDSPS